MFALTTVNLSLLLAVVACVIGGTLGGLVLAGRAPKPLGPIVEAGGANARMLGGAVIAAHGVVAALLGYDPRIGACMALTLCFAWLGAAGGRVLIGKRLKLPIDKQTLIFEVLMAIVLAMPLWTITHAISRTGVRV